VGHDIHVLAPHKIDAKVMGPYHPYSYCRQFLAMYSNSLSTNPPSPMPCWNKSSISWPRRLRDPTFPLKTGTGITMTTPRKLPRARPGMGSLIGAGQEHRGDRLSHGWNHFSFVVAGQHEGSRRHGQDPQSVGHKEPAACGVQRQV